MTHPTVDEHVAAIREVQAMLAEGDCLAAAGNDGRLLLLAHGWCNQVSRYAEAVVHLASHGLAAECHPITRAALEYAVTLHWVVQRGDAAVDAVLAEYRQGVSKAEQDASGGTFAEHFAALASDLGTVGIPAVTEE